MLILKRRVPPRTLIWGRIMVQNKIGQIMARDKILAFSLSLFYSFICEISLDFDLVKSDLQLRFTLKKLIK